MQDHKLVLPKDACRCGSPLEKNCVCKNVVKGAKVRKKGSNRERIVFEIIDDEVLLRYYSENLQQFIGGWYGVEDVIEVL